MDATKIQKNAMETGALWHYHHAPKNARTWMDVFAPQNALLLVIKATYYIQDMTAVESSRLSSLSLQWQTSATNGAMPTIAAMMLSAMTAMEGFLRSINAIINVIYLMTDAMEMAKKAY